MDRVRARAVKATKQGYDFRNPDIDLERIARDMRAGDLDLMDEPLTSVKRCVRRLYEEE